jgi:hypothetical protein
MTATDSNPPSGQSGDFDPHFTFNTPYGASAQNQCGRIVYSDFHVSASALVGSSDSCVTNADCGFTQTCVGSVPGSAGTCTEPCGTSADCPDTSYTCSGSTAGTCDANACTAKTNAYACLSGVCNAGGTCGCTNNSDCGQDGICNTTTHTCGEPACKQNTDCKSGKCDTTTGLCGCAHSSDCYGSSEKGDAVCTNHVCVRTGCAGTTTYSCSVGTCNPAHTACWCTQDSECASGLCVNQGQCAAGNCTGSGPADKTSCVAAGSGECFSASQCGQIATCTGAPKLGTCSKACTSNAQCTGGETCFGGLCQGCTSNSNCTDQTYKTTCSGSVPPVQGKCCFPQNPPNPPIPPNAPHAPNPAACFTDSTTFPESCVQAPLSAQEKALEFMFFDLTACVQPDTYSQPTPATYSPATFNLTFTGSCPADTKVVWREWDWQGVVPNGTSIAFSAQTGNAADGGALLPSPALSLATAKVSTTNVPSNWDYVLLDTSPKGTGEFNTAQPPVVSGSTLKVTVTMNPSPDGSLTPTLLAWRALFDCPPVE